MNRKARAARHSKSLLPNLRIPGLLWACGRPKLSPSSHKASKHSTLSVFGSSRNRCSTPGSIDSGLVNHLPELLVGDSDELSRPPEWNVTFVGGSVQGCH